MRLYTQALAQALKIKKKRKSTTCKFSKVVTYKLACVSPPLSPIPALNLPLEPRRRSVRENAAFLAYIPTWKSRGFSPRRRSLVSVLLIILMQPRSVCSLKSTTIARAHKRRGEKGGGAAGPRGQKNILIEEFSNSVSFACSWAQSYTHSHNSGRTSVKATDTGRRRG